MQSGQEDSWPSNTLAMGKSASGTYALNWPPGALFNACLDGVKLDYIQDKILSIVINYLIFAISIILFKLLQSPSMLANWTL